MITRKGQVTVFIFIGIFILVILGVFIYFRSELLVRTTQQANLGVSEQFRPVQQYYENCLTNAAVDGINLVGSQGGYLNVDEDNSGRDVVYGFRSYLDVLNDGNARVPYWYYKKDNEIDVVYVPSLADVQNNIQEYIGQNMGRCFENSTLLSNYNVDYGKINSKVEVQDEKVFVTILTPLNVELKGVRETIPEISIAIDAPVGKMYRKAVEIFNKENNDYFIEERTIDYMGLYDEIPFTGANFDCNAKIWSVEQVRNDFKRILSYNLPGLLTNDKTSDDRYNQLEINGEGMDVVFSYQGEWPFAMDAEPNTNGVLKSEQGIKNSGITKAISSLFCLQGYHFVYDVKYPALITIVSKGYVFQFATQVVVKNNAARKLPYEIGELEEKENICNNDNGILNLGVFGVDDNNELQPSDANINLKCLNQICGLGRSSRGVFVARTPSCLNAVVTADKQGYYSKEIVVNTNNGESNTIILEPLYKKNIEIRLIDKNGLREVKNEYVLVELENDNGYKTSINYPDETQIEIAAGDYKFKSYVFAQSQDSFEIGGQVKEQCVRVPRAGILGTLLSKEECVVNQVEPDNVNQVLIGGGEFMFFADRISIVNSNKLIVYLIVDDIPTSYEKIQAIDENLQYNYLDTRFKEP